MKSRENKRDFCLGGTQEEGEQRAAAFQKTQKEYVQEQRKKLHKKKERERAAKSKPLREKKTAKRELCVEKKIERREQSVAAFERNN